QMLAGARQTNKAANKAYTVALAKGNTALTDAVRQIPTAQIGKLQEALGATFIPVSNGILSKDYGGVESSGNFISVSVSITTGADGTKKPCDTPYFLGGAVGKWYEGTITIDGLSYANACIPEANIIAKTKEGFDANITFFQKLKAKYEKELHPLVKQLGALVTAKYNCVAGSTLNTQVASNTQGDSGTVPTTAAKKTLVRKDTLPVKTEFDGIVRYGTAADCKEGVEAKGMFQYPTGVDENTLGIIVDPEFNAKMKKERFTPDLPVTPIYDLIVEAVPTWGTCYTAEPEKFPTEPPKTLSFPVSIKLGNETLVGPGTLQYYGRKSDDGRFLYDWKLPGWKDGIAPAEKLEKLIEAVVKKDPSLKISVDIKHKDGTKELVSSDPIFGLCAPVWGTGRHSISYVRTGGSVYTVPKLTSASEQIRTEGFDVIDPYKTYRDTFSHAVDLRLYSVYSESSSWFERIEDLGKIETRPTLAMHNAIFEDAARSFTCKAEHYMVMTPDLDEKTGISSGGGSALFINPESGFPLVPLAMHEFSHAFAALNDEYPYPPPREGFRSVWTAFKNCSLAPDIDWVSGGIRYGDNNHEGCSSRHDFTSVEQKTFRPSENSLMRGYEGNDQDRLNVVSCGYVVAAIKGGKGPEYWKECMSLDTVKPTGTPPLHVGEASEDGGGTFIFVESFENGSLTGEVFEVADEEVGSDLGLYTDKLKNLKESIGKAIEVFKKKKSEAEKDKNKKGGELLQSDPNIDGPLYLLEKMAEELKTDWNGSLKDHAGLVYFFSHLDSLKNFNDTALSSVFQSAQDLKGFSYLYPPTPGKPLFVFIPGIGGEPGWRGAEELLSGESEKFNIVGYTYSPNGTGLAEELRSSFVKAGLDKPETVMATISMGNTILHEAILGDVVGKKTVFSNAHVFSVALLPGGTAKFFEYPNPPELLLQAIAPHGYRALEYMNPKNPVHADIATNMRSINAATKGIFYVNMRNDQHINMSSTRPLASLAYGDWGAYVANRDAVLGGMQGNSIKVFAPQKYVENNGKINYSPHINGFYAPELKTAIDSLLQKLNPPKPRSTITSQLAAVAASSGANTENKSDGSLEIFHSLLGGSTPDACISLTEALADAVMLQRGADFEA
ncbi:MAG: hypothetical protein Q7R74_01560, partial [bacterium]|nr:hypothetical protein [bacterium]